MACRRARALENTVRPSSQRGKRYKRTNWRRHLIWWTCLNLDSNPRVALKFVLSVAESIFLEKLKTFYKYRLAKKWYGFPACLVFLKSILLFLTDSSRFSETLQSSPECFVHSSIMQHIKRLSGLMDCWSWWELHPGREVVRDRSPYRSTWYDIRIIEEMLPVRPGLFALSGVIPSHLFEMHTELQTFRLL